VSIGGERVRIVVVGRIVDRRVVVGRVEVVIKSRIKTG
jgi:hypothetical protein